MSYVLGATLELKDKGFVTGVNDSTSATAKLKGELEGTGKMSGGFGSKMAKAGKTAALGVAAVGTAAVAMGVAAFAATKKVTDGFDHIAKTSRKMGVSSDFYQEMDYWAGQNGVSQNNMEKSMQRLNQRVGEARGGNEKYSGALKSLGIDMGAVKDGTLSTEDAMSQSITALSKMTNEQDKAALASELFGTKLSQELMPAIQDGSLSMEDAKKNAAELGFVIGEETLGAAEKFNDTWDDLTRGVQAFGVKAIAGMMPFFQTVMEFAIDKLPVAQAMFTTVFDAIGGVISWLGEKGKYVFNAIKEAVMNNQPVLQTMKDYYIQIWETIVGLYEAAKPVFTWMGEEGIPLVVDALAELIEFSLEIYNVIVDNWSEIEPFVIGIGVAFGVWKLATMLVTGVTTVLTGAQWLLNAALNANPLGIVVMLIGLVIGAGILLYKNWDTVKEKAGQLWEKVKEVFGGIYDWGMEKIQPVIGFFQTLSDKFNSFKDTIMSFKPPEWVMKIGGAIGSAASKVGGFISGSHATGLRKVPYDGYIAELHKDEAVLPKSEAERYRKGNVTTTNSNVSTVKNSESKSSNNTFHISINAQDRSATDIINELVPQLKLRLANM